EFAAIINQSAHDRARILQRGVIGTVKHGGSAQSDSGQGLSGRGDRARNERRSGLRQSRQGQTRRSRHQGNGQSGEMTPSQSNHSLPGRGRSANQFRALLLNAS